MDTGWGGIRHARPKLIFTTIALSAAVSLELALRALPYGFGGGPGANGARESAAGVERGRRYVVLQSSYRSTFSSEYGTTPPIEITDLFHEIEQLPAKPARSFLLQDVCFGFCYGP